MRARIAPVARTEPPIAASGEAREAMALDEAALAERGPFTQSAGARIPSSPAPGSNAVDPKADKTRP
jgi:hypothetical protein